MHQVVWCDRAAAQAIRHRNVGDILPDQRPAEADVVLVTPGRSLVKFHINIRRADVQYRRQRGADARLVHQRHAPAKFDAGADAANREVKSPAGRVRSREDQRLDFIASRAARRHFRHARRHTRGRGETRLNRDSLDFVDSGDGRLDLLDRGARPSRQRADRQTGHIHPGQSPGKLKDEPGDAAAGHGHVASADPAQAFQPGLQFRQDGAVGVIRAQGHIRRRRAVIEAQAADGAFRNIQQVRRVDPGGSTRRGQNFNPVIDRHIQRRGADDQTIDPDQGRAVRRGLQRDKLPARIGPVGQQRQPKGDVRQRQTHGIRRATIQPGKRGSARRADGQQVDADALSVRQRHRLD